MFPHKNNIIAKLKNYDDFLSINKNEMEIFWRDEIHSELITLQNVNDLKEEKRVNMWTHSAFKVKGSKTFYKLCGATLTIKNILYFNQLKDFKFLNFISLDNLNLTETKEHFSQKTTKTQIKMYCQNEHSGNIQSEKYFLEE